MNKRELIWFLEPFTDELEIRSECGCDLSVKYTVPGGEGIAVITTHHFSSHGEKKIAGSRHLVIDEASSMPDQAWRVKKGGISK